MEKRPEIAGLLSQKAQLDGQIAWMKVERHRRIKQPRGRKLIAQADDLAKDWTGGGRACGRSAKGLLREPGRQGRAGEGGPAARSDRRRRGVAHLLIGDIERLEKEAQDFNNAAVDLDDLKPEVAEAAAAATRIARKWRN